MERRPHAGVAHAEIFCKRFCVRAFKISADEQKPYRFRLLCEPAVNDRAYLGGVGLRLIAGAGQTLLKLGKRKRDVPAAALLAGRCLEAVDRNVARDAAYIRGERMEFHTASNASLKHSSASSGDARMPAATRRQSEPYISAAARSPSSSLAYIISVIRLSLLSMTPNLSLGDRGPSHIKTTFFLWCFLNYIIGNEKKQFIFSPSYDIIML